LRLLGARSLEGNIQQNTEHGGKEQYRRAAIADQGQLQNVCLWCDEFFEKHWRCDINCGVKLHQNRVLMRRFWNAVKLPPLEEDRIWQVAA
jgi:hypothetical protein